MLSELFDYISKLGKPEPPKVIVMIGPPGSGKGTQSQLLAQLYNMVHLSTGDLCRAAIQTQSDLGKQIEPYIVQGDFVPDTLILDLLKSALDKHPKDSRVILDGFPRTLQQAKQVSEFLEIGKVFLLDVDDEYCETRIKGRRVDPQTAHLYNVNLHHLIDPAVQSRLIIRDSDVDEQRVKLRLKMYRGHLPEIIEYFKDKVHVIDGTKAIEEVSTQLNKLALGSSWREDERNQKRNAFIDKYEEEVFSQVKIEAAPSESVDVQQSRVVPVGITLHVPDIESRVPVNVCCIVDISGSMSDEARFQDPENENNTISEGLSILDLVKHAVKTVICTLTDNDWLSIVVFDDAGATPFPLRRMDDLGKKLATEAAEALATRGCTNIWAGLQTGLDSLRTPLEDQADKMRKNTVILLTDGQPNAAPQEGEVSALQNYFNKYPKFKCQVNTFGFGYNLNSRLLHDLAFTGLGTFSFIPDAKILGTCFVNAVANICSNLTQKCQVHLVLKNGAKFAGAVDGKYSFHEVDGSRLVQIGPLQYGQNRDLAVPIELPAQDEPYLEVIIELEKSNGSTYKTSYLASNRTSTPSSIAAALRNHVVSSVATIVEQWEKGDHSTKPMEDLVSQLANCPAASLFTEGADNRLVALNDDVSGRVCKAVSTQERFNRWGKHYLLSINRSHQLQIRTNFMDPGLQIYGGCIFRKLEDEGGKIFVSLPMKKREHYQSNTPAAPTATNTTYYAGGGGGCFDSSSTVKVLREVDVNQLEEVEVEVGTVRRHDLVRVVNGRGEEVFSRVLCVVKIEIDRKAQQEMVRLGEGQGGLTITKNHPIRVNGRWCLPKEVPGGNTVHSTTAHVYNFVLEHSHVLLVNGVECCTFGHRLQLDPIAWHPFYATEQVINTLATLPGWEHGFVTVNGSIRKLAVSSFSCSSSSSSSSSSLFSNSFNRSSYSDTVLIK